MKEIFTKRAGGKYEILFAISNKKYATLHMQNRLEIETLARAGRGLEMSDIKIGDKDMKVFFTDIG